MKSLGGQIKCLVPGKFEPLVLTTFKIFFRRPGRIRVSREPCLHPLFETLPDHGALNSSVPINPPDKT